MQNQREERSVWAGIFCIMFMDYISKVWILFLFVVEGTGNRK